MNGMRIPDKVMLMAVLMALMIAGIPAAAARGADAQAGEPLPPTGLARFERLFEEEGWSKDEHF